MSGASPTAQLHPCPWRILSNSTAQTDAHSQYELLLSMPVSSNPIDRYCVAAFFLLLLAVAVYQKALWFSPGSGDDLRILSSVSQRHNPLSYFATDWGMENTYLLGTGQKDTTRRTYRPLHSISIWLGYRAFGVWAYPNQLLNLILHILNILLLLRILQRVGLEVAPASLLATLGLVSLYTASPATWVSDRQTLVVALAVLIFINHVVESDGGLRSSINPWLVAGLTLVAVLFKESGLIIPLVAGAFVLFAPYKGPKRIHLAICVLLAASYLGLRVLLFGSNAFAYASEGFVFGNQYYTLLSDLPWQIALWARAETVVKNFLCVFLPVFDPYGRIDSLHELFANVLWWLPTVVLAAAATRRSLTRVQWLALAVIAMNSALHVQVFRYRIEYVSQLAFCLYVASSPIWQASHKKVDWGGRRQLAGICCGFLALVSISQVNRYIHSNWVQRQDEVTKQRLTTVLQSYPISGRIVEQVLARYAPTAETSPAKAPKDDVSNSISYDETRTPKPICSERQRHSNHGDSRKNHRNNSSAWRLEANPG